MIRPISQGKRILRHLLPLANYISTLKPVTIWYLLLLSNTLTVFRYKLWPRTKSSKYFVLTITSAPTPKYGLILP